MLDIHLPHDTVAFWTLDAPNLAFFAVAGLEICTLDAVRHPLPQTSLARVDQVIGTRRRWVVVGKLLRRLILGAARAMKAFDFCRSLSLARRRDRRQRRWSRTDELSVRP